MSRTIVIAKVGPGDWTIHDGARFCDRLCTDEVIAMAVKLLAAEFPGFDMHTAEEVRDRAAFKEAKAAARSNADLLEACEQAEHWLTEHESSNYDLVRPTEILRVLRASIAKAKGGA
jgi:outer membrane cobalamin receptor